MASRHGLLGGTFDPVHEGHLAIATQCATQLGLDRVHLVPSHLPPHREAPEASAGDRLEMTRLAVAGHPRLDVLDLEVTRGGVSYTVDTVAALRERWPGEAIVLLLGWDAAQVFPEWKDPGRIASLCEFAIFNRQGQPPPSAARVSGLGFPAATPLLEVDSPDVSATAVRARLAKGLDVSSMVPAAVLAHIRKRHLYGT